MPAAPPVPATTPHAPAGLVIENGLPTIITLDLDPTAAFWEVETTPPGIDGGDANDLTNMHNIDWRTYAPRTLKTLTEAQTTCQVAPEFFTQAEAAVNVETTITVHMPGGAKLAFYGYLKSWTPSAWVEGSPPQGTATFHPTNRDPLTGAEEGPVLVLPTGASMSRIRGGSPKSSRLKRRQPLPSQPPSTSPQDEKGEGQEERKPTGTGSPPRRPVPGGKPVPSGKA